VLMRNHAALGTGLWTEPFVSGVVAVETAWH
jgi:hypothetical protein